MRNALKRLVAIFMCVAMISLTTVTAFASETEIAESNNMEVKDCITLEVTSEGVTSATNMEGEIIPMSSISGYEYGYLTSSSHAVCIYPEGSGWGGMGVTIRASSSWNGYMSCNMFDSEGNVQFSNYAIYSNGETYFNDLFTVNPDYYMFNFLGIPANTAVNVYIWIYG